MKVEEKAQTFAKRIGAEFWPVSSLTGSTIFLYRYLCLSLVSAYILGHQVEEFFRRVACISYQMLIKQQIDGFNQPKETATVKTQLAVTLSSNNSNFANDFQN